MNELNYKAFRILSVLLVAEKPLNAVEIASSTGFLRQTIEPFMAKIVVKDSYIDVGSTEHAWVINEKHRQEIADIVESVFSSYRKRQKGLHVHLIDADSKDY